MRALLIVMILVLGQQVSAAEFAEIRRDVTAMEHILRGVFQAKGSCCNASIESLYLARQGVVFSVSMSGPLQRFAVEVHGDSPMDMHEDMHEDITEQLEEMGELEERELNFELMRQKGAPGVFFFADESPQSTAEDRQTRVAMRETARMLRDLSRQIAEKEIELIHLDDADDRVAAVTEMATLNARLNAEESRLGELQDRLQARSNSLKKQQAARQAEAKAARQKQVKQLEENLLRTFCDYGGTLRRLPGSEYINLMIDPGESGLGNHFFVFRQTDITNCKSGPDGLRKSAVNYRF